MKIVSTFSLFHFSMKASSWDWAADVSSVVILSTADEPVFTLAFFSADHDVVDPASLSWSARKPTLAPLSFFSAMSRFTRVRRSPPWWCRASARGRAAPGRSTAARARARCGSSRAPGDAELTLAAEVDEHAEHREHAVVLGPRRAEREDQAHARDRRIGLDVRLDHPAADTTVVVDVVDEDLRSSSWSPR